jgi:hypothetical protein
MNDIAVELRFGALSAADLRERLAVSPATLMRMVRAAGPSVVRIGRGRATEYAWRESWPTLDSSRFPLFRITDGGVAVSAGELLTLTSRQSVWLPDGTITDGLPMELVDAQPSGFLGRHFAALHADLRLPARVTDWSDHHILLAMSRRGEDQPGNLLVGDESFARWQSLNVTSATRYDYPTLANATVAGRPPGSSAGGEQPKFGAFVDGRHCLVKFAARGGSTDVVARRWCDLLILENIALELISAHGIAAARTALVEAPSYWFLESERFDRVGRRGRVAVMSLAAIHNDLADSWAHAATVLREAERVNDEDARRLRWLDAFGAMIGNTDRHQHNVLFFTGGRLRLAPAFDQVSMLYAPTTDGQVPPRVLTIPPVTSATLEVWDDAARAAREYWTRGSEDRRVSDSVRAICAANTQLLGPTSS